VWTLLLVRRLAGLYRLDFAANALAMRAAADVIAAR